MAEVWFVTGANRGIGLEYTRQLLASGKQVFATARKPNAADELHALAVEYGDLISVEELDTGDQASVEALATKLAGKPIDVLVNNGGIYGGVFSMEADQQSLTGMDYSVWEEIIRVNVMGPFRMVAALLPNLARGDRKLVINMSSDLGSIGNNSMGKSHAYRSSKAALNMLTKGLSIDLADDGVSVVSITPGWTKTDLGGANAQWETDVSVAHQLKVIAGLTAANNGQFINLLGEPVAW